VNEEYLAKLFTSDMDINHEHLTKLLQAYLGIESYKISKNIERTPTKSSQGYELEVTIFLKFFGLNDLHYIKYSGISKNFNQ
jgi:hypothetical protein